MKFEARTVRNTINKAYLKEPIKREAFNRFKELFRKLIDEMKQAEKADEREANDYRTPAAHFKEMGHTGEELDRLMQPLLSFHSQLNEEMEAYEGVKRWNLGALYEFNNIVRWLMGVRIALDMSQKEFAEALGVSEAQVSRDETNEYHGITVDKVQRILETFNFRWMNRNTWNPVIE